LWAGTAQNPAGADRNQGQQEINQCIAAGTVDIHQRAAQAGGLLAECITSVINDLGDDLQAEALRVTSTVH